MTDSQTNKEEIYHEFKEVFHKDPSWIIRCPGRVNLIGEHIDYNGYGVLPMAIEQSVFIAAAPNEDNVIRFRNGHDKFKPFDWSLDKNWKGVSNPEWYHYFLSGWKGVIDRLEETVPVSGLDLFVLGNVPPAAGLSSSSAMVCSAALTTWTCYTNKLFEGYTKEELVELATKSERLIGVEGGGMDQAVVVLAEAGSALHIDFDPLKVRKVNLPEGALFAVLHCGKEARKAATSYYNERVVECRIAAQFLHLQNNGTPEYKDIRRLRDFQEKAKVSLRESTDLSTALFDKEAYNREDLIQRLGTNEDDFIKYSLNGATTQKSKFDLLGRAVHVFEEAERVDLFEEACNANDLVTVGELMNKSHESCAQLYECSCPEMDETVSKCRQEGVLGARLTGAGWGGCAVALVPANKVREVEEKVKVLFWTKPSAGIEAWRV